MHSQERAVYVRQGFADQAVVQGQSEDPTHIHTLTHPATQLPIGTHKHTHIEF